MNLTRPLAALAALTIAGACSGRTVDNGDATDARPRSTDRPAETTGPDAGYFPATPEDVYVELMQADFGTTRAQALDLGDAICDMLDAYGDVDALIADLAYELTVDPDAFGGYDATDVGTMLGYAAVGLCPEWADEL